MCTCTKCINTNTYIYTLSHVSNIKSNLNGMPSFSDAIHTGEFWRPFYNLLVFEELKVSNKVKLICIAIQHLTDSWSQDTVNLIVLLTAPGCETQ